MNGCYCNNKKRTLLAILLSTIPFVTFAQSPSNLTLDQKEDFLRNGKIANERFIPVGVTHPLRVTMEYNGLTHDAHIQTIDEDLSKVRSENGRALPVHDYFGFNVAAYEMDKLLGLNMTPPSVKRKYNGKWAAVTWWIDDVSMTNLERIQKKIDPPDLENWNRQIYLVRIMNELLADADPNMSNVLITKDWKIWTIDRTRAFPSIEQVQNTNGLTKCERHLFAALRQLNEQTLQQKLGEYLSKTEVHALEIRRELILKLFDQQIAKRGEADVLYDLQEPK